jgi:hypothetical protein
MRTLKYTTLSGGPFTSELSSSNSRTALAQAARFFTLYRAQHARQIH